MKKRVSKRRGSMVGVTHQAWGVSDGEGEDEVFGFEDIVETLTLFVEGPAVLDQALAQLDGHTAAGGEEDAGFLKGLAGGGDEEGEGLRGLQTQALARLGGGQVAAVGQLGVGSVDLAAGEHHGAGHERGGVAAADHEERPRRVTAHQQHGGGGGGGGRECRAHAGRGGSMRAVAKQSERAQRAGFRSRKTR
jgi:hypothetical protein